MNALAQLALAMALSVDTLVAAFGLRSPLGITCLTFAAIQGLCFTLGFGLGHFTRASNAYAQGIQRIDHWIAFFILAALAVKSFFDASTKPSAHQELVTLRERVSLASLSLLAFATSVDAAGAGLSIALLGGALGSQLAMIVGVTALAVALARLTWERIPPNLRARMPYLSSMILLSLGVKILWDHDVFK